MLLSNSLNYILTKIHARREFTDGYITAIDQEIYFNKISNRKSDGTLRYIYEPKTDEHSNLYKALYELLKPYQIRLHPAAHGFRSGYSNVTNASQHLGAGHLFNIDIENFYGQVDMGDVKDVFTSLGADEEVSSYLSKLCTVNGILPQGFNTSPDLANHHLYKLDVELSEYSESEGITYTRYVDDMSFSSDSTMNASEICEIVESHGLPLAESKRKYQKRGSNQYVTGLTIFDTDRPRISKKYKRRLRLELYIIKKVGIYSFVIRQNEIPDKPEDAQELIEWKKTLDEWTDTKLANLRGRLDYINGVEPEVAKKMYPVLEQIIEDRKIANQSANSGSVSFPEVL